MLAVPTPSGVSRVPSDPAKIRLRQTAEKRDSTFLAFSYFSHSHGATVVLRIVSLLLSTIW